MQGKADRRIILHNREQVNFGYIYVIHLFTIFYESIVNYPCSERHSRGLRWEKGWKWDEEGK